MILPASSRIQTAIRPFTRKGAWHWVRFVIFLVVGSFLGHVFSTADWLTTTRYKIYQRQLGMRTRAALYPQRTALVLLDDDDYWGNHFAARAPVKRAVLAALLDKLNAAGVNTIALDIDLRSPRPDDAAFQSTPFKDFADYSAEDATLVKSIQAICDSGHHIVLASSIRVGDDGYELMPSIYDGHIPAPAQTTKDDPCIRTGYIQLPDDMRRMPGVISLGNGAALDSLSLAVTRIADKIAYASAAGSTERGFRFSEYLTQSDFQRGGFILHGADVLASDPLKLRPRVADRIVFIGANWHNNAYNTGPMADNWDSPGGPEPGVMLHANYVEAMLDRTGTFGPLADSTAEILEISLACVLALIGALEIHSAWKWSAFAAGFLFSVLLTYTLLQNLGLFLDFAIPLFVVAGHTLLEEGLAMKEKLEHMLRTREENRHEEHS